MKRIWQLLNIFSVLFAIIMNILIGAQLLGLPSIKAISDTYATLLTPASYAFSIWSVIYLLLVAFVMYQARDIVSPSDKNTLPRQIGPWFLIANLANGLWTYLFVQQWIGLSLGVLLILVVSLYFLLARLRIAVYDAPWRTIVFVWWPLLIYTGWVSVALVVNVASWLASCGILVSPFVACITLGLLSVVGIILLIKRNVRELLIASTWAIIGIAIQQIEGNVAVFVTSLLCATFLIGACGVHALYQSIIATRAAMSE